MFAQAACFINLRLRQTFFEIPDCFRRHTPRGDWLQCSIFAKTEKLPFIFSKLETLTDQSVEINNGLSSGIGQRFGIYPIHQEYAAEPSHVRLRTNGGDTVFG
jgi:hypothetical protein